MQFVQFGVVVYGRGVLTEYNIPFDYTNSKEALQQKVSDIPYDNPAPGRSRVNYSTGAKSLILSTSTKNKKTLQYLKIQLHWAMQFTRCGGLQSDERPANKECS